MTNCIWLLALVVAINARSLHVPHGYGIPHRPPPHSPYYYAPYSYAGAGAFAGYGYRSRPTLYNPPGSYYDSNYGVHRFLPGGGNPVTVDYVGLADF